MKLKEIWSSATAAVNRFFEPPKGFKEFLDQGQPVHPLPMYLTLRHLEKNPG